MTTPPVKRTATQAGLSTNVSPQKQKESSETRFKIDAERGFDLLEENKLIKMDEKKRYYAKVFPSNSTLELSLAFKAIVQGIVDLSNKHFKFKHKDVLTAHEFREASSLLVKAYSDYILASTKTCADKALNDCEVDVTPKLDPLLPIEFKPCGTEVSSIKTKFQAIYDFFSVRRYLLQGQLAAELKRFLDHLWEKEFTTLFSFYEGREALVLGSKLCSLMIHGDFNINKRTEELRQRLLQVRKLCEEVSKVEAPQETLKPVPLSTCPLFPLEKQPKSSLQKQFVGAAQHLYDWVVRFKAKAMFCENPHLAILVEKIRELSFFNSQRQQLHEELIVCDKIVRELNLKSTITPLAEIQFKDDKFKIPSRQLEVIVRSSEASQTPIVWNWVIKDEFNAFFNALIDAPATFTLGQHLAILAIAERLKIPDIANRAFHHLLIYLDKKTSIDDLTEIENVLSRSKAINHEKAKVWQEHLDRWISEWLASVSSDKPNLPSWHAVQQLDLNGCTNYSIMRAVAKLPSLRELKVAKLSDLYPLEEGAYPQVSRIAIDADLTLDEVETAELQQVLALPSLKTLELTCADLDTLAEVIEKSKSKTLIQLIVPKPIHLPLTNVPNVQSVEVICETHDALRMMARSLKHGEKVSLHLRGSPEQPNAVHRALLEEIRPLKLLEIGSGWGIYEEFLLSAMRLQMEILCLGSHCAKTLCHVDRNQKTSIPELTHLTALQIKLAPTEFKLFPTLLPKPIKELMILLNDESAKMDLTKSWLMYFGEMTKYFKEHFKLIGHWVLDNFLCQSLVYEKQAEKVVVRLKPKLHLENISSHTMAEQRLVSAYIAPLFPTVIRIDLQWIETTDEHPHSHWTFKMINGNKTFSKQ